LKKEGAGGSNPLTRSNQNNNMAKEESIYLTISKYLKVKHPGIVFRFDYGAGVKLTMGQAIKQKAMQSGRAYPDLFIAKTSKVLHERDNFTFYGGLFVEIKQADKVLYRPKDAKDVLKGDYKLRKKGDWYDLHTEEQANMLALLRKQGYRAEFGIGFDNTIKIIETYLKNS
jgi:hypothetical protein